MKTLVTRSIDEAAGIIRAGGIVAFPTETVYGLGADVFNEAAIRRVFEAKQRPADNPLIAHIGESTMLRQVVTQIPAHAKALIEAFFPGPLTIVLQKSEAVPLLATAGLDTLGIRMPASDTAREFLMACGTPVVAPSANISGRPSPTTWEAVRDDLEGRIDCILQGSVPEIGIESTVIDCTEDVPILLRKGAISLRDLREIVPETREYVPTAETPRSPGLKHKHYSPRARVLVVEPGEELTGLANDAYIGLTNRSDTFRLSRIRATTSDYAASLFAFFRECDHAGVDRIFCEAVDEEGIGAALMDRIRRASAD